MATVKQNPFEKVRKQLALAVRRIQWSYAIFWSISPAQPGVLQWYDGYYNGDIKTRKTVQSGESNADQLGFQRSDQLRELYESLSIGETKHPAKRPTAALVPEDLSNAEWFFVTCMSFEFEINQELPGRALAKNEAIWLCNAHRADTKVFLRSLLAKSAAIQTIVCFPHLGGVIELGTTKLVQENVHLIHHVRTNFLEDNSATHVQSLSDDGLVQNHVFPSQALDQDDVSLDCPSLPNNCSDEFANTLLIEDSNWQFIDDDDAISNCVNNSSDCVSQTYEDPETVLPHMDKVIEDYNNNNSTGLTETDTFYQSVLSNLLKSSHQLILGPYFRNRSKESSFNCWVNDGVLGAYKSVPVVTPQRLLKKVLIEVPRLHQTCTSAAVDRRYNSSKPDDENDRNHVLSERKRREKINERFLILGSLIPSGGKVDKISILDYTIEYLGQLESKVEELESYKEATELQYKKQHKPQDAMEGTSDNYGSDKIGNNKKLSSTKRKLCEADRTRGKNSRTRLRDSSKDAVHVEVSDKFVLIETRCSWSENMTVKVMGAVRKLRLNIQTVESSKVDGILSMTVKAESKALKAPSASAIKQALQKMFFQELKKQNGV